MGSRFSTLASPLFFVASVLWTLLFPLEAHVSVQPQFIDLKTMASHSSIILVAKKSENTPSKTSEKTPDRFHKYEVLEVLRGGDLGVAVGKSIHVYPANYELHKDIGAARDRGEAAPIPILDVYQPLPASSAGPRDKILFLRRNHAGEIQFAVEGGIESVQNKAAVQKVLADAGVKSDPVTVRALAKFDSLPQIVQDGEASEKRMEDLRKQSKPFVEAVAYRNLVTCESGAHEFTNIKYVINSGKKSLVGTTPRLEIANAEIHEARDHGAKLSATLLQFLEGI